ncbi:MAG: hypothetical protein Q7J07_10090 [Pelolinea sp.]|nr:hypothetical protein [Pelolinea sp.]
MKKFVQVLGFVLIAALVVSCAPSTVSTPAAEVAVDVALKLSGLVDKGWSVEDLKVLPMTDADYTNKDGETTTYNGVGFADLFEEAGIGKYSTVILIAADDYAIEIDQKTLEACDTCIIAIGEDGTLRSVMPDMQGMFQVKDLVALEVK